MQAALNLVGILLIQCTMPSSIGGATSGQSGGGRTSAGKAGGKKAARASGCCAIMHEHWRALLTCGIFALLLSFIRSARYVSAAYLSQLPVGVAHVHVQSLSHSTARLFDSVLLGQRADSSTCWSSAWSVSLMSPEGAGCRGGRSENKRLRTLDSEPHWSAIVA